MTPERWELLKDIFTRALEQPSELRDNFVREACSADTEMVSELRRLLDEHDRQDSNLSRPALEAERVSDSMPPEFSPEKVLAGRFRIVRYISRGGMGEVYEAEDLVLKERVALKTIRPEIAQDEGVLAMFKTEIQLARKVTHPNVCRIHDFAQHVEPLAGGRERATIFLTMELLGGETLAQYLSARGPLSQAQALPLIEQLAAALEAAHAARVIHRDFKPGNVMVMARKEDPALRAVVTDFGMAILAQEAGADRAPLARGTPRYMAPEQVENGPVTAATDVYSLALVIAEMIGARRQTAAGSRLKTLLGFTSSKYRAPKISIPPSCASWSVVLRKCLSYEAEHRYGSPAEVVAALTGLHGGSSQRRNKAGLALGLAAIVVAVAVVQPWLRFRDQPDTPVNRRLFVEDAKLQAWNASPNGSLLVATQWGAGGAGGNLVLRDVQTGETRPLTQRTGSDYFGAQFAIFSPDGKWIAYHWDENDREGDLRMVSADGANTRIINSDPAYWVTPEDWSPDGRRILANFRPSDGSVQIGWISVDDGAVTFIRNPGRGLWSKPRFSADGNSIFVNTLQPGDDIARDIYRIALDGTEQARPVEHPAEDVLLDLSPDRTRLIFASDRQGDFDLWSAPVEAGSPAGVERLWPNIGRFQSLNITRSGAFFYRLEPQVQEVYTAVLDTGAGTTVSPPQRVMRRFRAPSGWPGWSPDGRQLLFVYRLDETTLGIHTPATQQTRLLRLQLASFQRPQWHPSGQWIDVTGWDRQGRSGHFRVDPVTGDASLLVSSQELESEFEGIWSQDGITTFNRFNQWQRGIFRFRMDTKARQILYVPPAGTDLSQENLNLSPDGRWLAFHARDKAAGTSFLMLMPVEGGPANPLLTVRSPEEFVMGSFAWTPDSQALLAVRTPNRLAYAESSELWRVPTDGSPPSRLDFPEMRMAQMRLNPDGKTVAFVSGRAESEVWVLEGLSRSTLEK